MAMRYPVVSENFTISRVHRDWDHQDDSRSVGSKLKKHDSIFRSLAEAQIDTNKTTSHHSRRLSSLVASAREGASKQLQLEERTKILEQNLATTNVKVVELGHAYVSIEGRTETIENEFRGLRQQLQAVNEQLAHIVTTVGTNNNINWNYGEITVPGPGPEHVTGGGQELIEVDNVVVASPSTPAAARQKTKCIYCSKFLLDVGRHIKERCHFAPVEIQFSATRYRLRERQMCDICGGRFEKQGMTRHRITCARRYNVGADVIAIDIDTDPLGCEASNRWSPPVLRQHSHHHPQKKK